MCSATFFTMWYLVPGVRGGGGTDNIHDDLALSPLLLPLRSFLLGAFAVLRTFQVHIAPLAETPSHRLLPGVPDVHELLHFALFKLEVAVICDIRF